MYPDDSWKDLSTVLSHMAGRPLSKEQISKAMELPRSTHYDQREKGTLITADNLQRLQRTSVSTELNCSPGTGSSTPKEITSVAEELGGQSPPSFSWSRTAVVKTQKRGCRCGERKFRGYGHAMTRRRFRASQSPSLVTLRIVSRGCLT